MANRATRQPAGLRPRLKAVAQTGMKASAAAFDVVRPPGRGVVVLGYHRVGGRTPVAVDLPTALFEDQIAYLAETERVVTLRDALTVLASTATPDEDQIVLTFDDGTADFVDLAVPILERYGVPVTLYVATDFVENGRSFPDDGFAASWAGLAESVSTGLVAIGSHTHTHALLDRISASAVETELRTSKSLVEDRLGVECVDFAYPKAVAGSAEADVLVRRHFRSAALAGLRPNPYDGETDLFQLRRSAIQVSDGMRWFRRKVAGGLALEGTLREYMNTRRYVGVSH